jgi:ABC-type multidrug transport system ATPase subunit
MADPSLPLELAEVCYTYPKFQSGVREISIGVEQGIIYGLLGVNGAGKTTLMRLMTGLIRPARGSIRWFGAALGHGHSSQLRLIGSLIERPSLYAHLTAREHLQVFACYTGSPSAAVDGALEMTGISDVADRRVRHLSMGMKQRLGLANALLHDPPVLILDEPTNGLDPEGIVSMRELLRRLASEFGKTIIVSSHLLAEVEKTATRIGILHDGRLRFEGTTDDLSAALGARAGLLLRVGSVPDASIALEAAGIDFRLQTTGVLVEAPDDEAAAAAVRLLSSEGVAVYEARRETGSLERDFLSIIGGNHAL